MTKKGRSGMVSFCVCFGFKRFSCLRAEGVLASRGQVDLVEVASSGSWLGLANSVHTCISDEAKPSPETFE